MHFVKEIDDIEGFKENKPDFKIRLINKLCHLQKGSKGQRMFKLKTLDQPSFPTNISFVMMNTFLP